MQGMAANPSAKGLIDVLYRVPEVLQRLRDTELHALQATCKEAHCIVRGHISSIQVVFEEQSVLLLVSGGWSHLRKLSLRDINLQPVSAVLLSRSCWPLLGTLDLSNNPDAAVFESMAQGFWPSLTELNLSQNPCSAESAACLIHCQLPHLLKLDLSGTNMHLGIASLVECGWANLQILLLKTNHLKHESLAQLVNGAWPLLEHLDLATNDLQPSDFYLLNNAHWPLIKILGFSNNGGASKVATSKASCGMSNKIRRHLQVLDLHNCNLGPAEVASICQGQYPQLTALHLSANQMCGQAIKVLVTIPWPTLQCLSLSWSDVDAVGVNYLVQGHFPKLVYLDLIGNLLSVQALQAILTADWPDLVHLLLSRNYLGTGPAVSVNGHLLPLTGDDDTVPEWVKRQWPRLTTLAVQGCNIDFDL